jgi:hypothetical protein
MTERTETPWWWFDKMRVGRRKLRTLYLVDPSSHDPEADVLIGLVDTPDLAAEMVKRWNANVPRV